MVSVRDDDKIRASMASSSDLSHFLRNRTAVVTGAGSGIGRATAFAVGAAGADAVVLVGRRSRPLQETADLMRQRGSTGLVVAGDVASEELCALAVARAAERAPLAALVHAAGEVRPRPLLETSLDDWNAQITTNLTASFLLAREALPHLASCQGAAVVVSSISGVPGPAKFPGFAAYAASKGGALLLVEALAPEFAAAGARINAVSPGSVDTEMLRQAAPGVQPDMEPPEVARAILLLLSPASRPMNGRNLSFYG